MARTTEVGTKLYRRHAKQTFTLTVVDGAKPYKLTPGFKNADKGIEVKSGTKFLNPAAAQRALMGYVGGTAWQADEPAVKEPTPKKTKAVKPDDAKAEQDETAAARERLGR